MRWLLVFLLVVPAVAQTSIALSESTGNYTSYGQGINLNTEDPFDSHILKNVVAGHNPSQQPLLNVYLINVASLGSPATTTVVDYNQFSNIFANQYQGLSYVVLCSSKNNFPGSVQICNGSSSSGACTGTVTSNTIPAGGVGATFILSSCANGFNVNDTIAIGTTTGGQIAGSALSTYGW